ncbi:NADPH-dependent FMN reductase [Methanobrevibacter sp. 87.7]|uniref:flavodoxin family protein n=1 Tax=Methanobrevibacter sp. 87.7 TaxID=387957 RepID=UPI000B50685E|nr:flavodoxin family protein [Methanobrevibacter sp. 87.7]OWT33565.1 NADPH-dependent FMN reductase [Methanobrevibacter sp. 87.7]
MKVLLVNGSPHRDGCTNEALSIIKEELAKNDVDSEIFWIGNRRVRGCVACNKCVDDSFCVFTDDCANDLIKEIIDTDGVIIGSPVYFASPNGALCAILDRVFYNNGKRFAFKPAASIVSCRRGGSTASFDRLNKYFTISNMPVVSSQYWNGVHGNTPEEVRLDKEGVQIMRTLAKNMAWMLKSISHEDTPELEDQIFTNFIRPMK